jgi:hypothetical protein
MRGRQLSIALRGACAVPALALLLGCATRSQDVPPLATTATEFLAWGCERIDAESDRVQQRAADVAYAVDVRANNNVFAMGLGLSVFWPALLAMRPDGPEAAELARLKGRHEALRAAASQKACPDGGLALPAARAAALPVARGETLVYEERVGNKGPAREWRLRLAQLKRDELEWTQPQSQAATHGGEPVWRSDFAGNITQVPAGELRWPRLLRHEMGLGEVVSGEMSFADNSGGRARVRGQVVALGPQSVGGRRFEVLVLELFGDAQRGETSTRLDGVLVVDRASGVLLRLDLRSAQSGFAFQRRLLRVEAAPG